MTMNIRKSECVYVIFAALLSASYLVKGENQDEGSCICGLNKSILDQLERIVTASTSSTCSAAISPQQDSSEGTKPDGSGGGGKFEQGSNNGFNSIFDNNNNNNNQQNVEPGIQNSKQDPSSSNQQSAQNNGNNGNSNDGSINNTNDNNSQQQWNIIAKLEDEIHRLESMINNNNNPPTTSPNQQQQQQQPFNATNPNGKPMVDNGFLGGVTATPLGSSGSNSVPNQQQKVDENQMANAIESTVPNIVSNIFSNIQNLTLQTERNPQKPGDSSNTLTSIDGSSINVQGGTSDQITAQGEKLFLTWIQHQIDALHLTSSMAKYVQASAINLFRKIVKQYVNSIKKAGGSVEDNVKRATQMALNNTQNLIGFLLKHYTYFAAGLMQIIGEQVSRIGKQIDSTGATIATIDLNPFVIISKVMDSLPNPSDYSNYFREIGKQLIGDLPWNQHTNNNNNNEDSSKTTGGGENQTAAPQQQQSGGLFKKTMGALGKTLTSWIG